MRLRTFGGLWLQDSAGVELTSARPRRLALLSVLATASPRGVSRERLLGVLWPDVDEERGRHALAQTVYSLRQEMGDAVVGVGELRLDPALLTSDVAEFSDALARDDAETAARLYLGGFLDGFYLADAPEFERWAETERSRLARLAIAAVEKVARAADSVVWRRRLTELDPMRGQYAMLYMEALASAGDRVGALAHARVHETAVRQELETEPDPEVTRLAERLRQEPQIPRNAPDGKRESVIPRSPSDAGEIVIPRSASDEGSAVGAARNDKTVRRSMPRSVMLLAAGVLALTAFLVWRDGGASNSSPRLVAVGSLRDEASQTGAVGDGSGGVLTDMLATSLARVPGVHVVANSRLVELLSRNADKSASAVADAARRAGAREILEGELTAVEGGDLRLQLRRVDLATGVVSRGYTVRARDRYAAVDSATAIIAQDFGFASPIRPVAEISTSSPMAYRFYEEGLRAYYQFDAATAYRLMESALREDSTFAMAAYYAWRSGQSAGHRMEPGLQERARRLAPRAADRERWLILGMTRVADEDPTALAPAESLTIRFPADPDGQALLGLVRAMRGDYREAASAYLESVALDSAGSAKQSALCRACESLERLFWVYIEWDSLAAVERSLNSWIGFRPRAPEPLWALADLRWRQGRWHDADVVLQKADSFDSRKTALQPTLYRAAIRRGAYDELGRDAAAAIRDPDRDRRSEARWVWLIALRNQGRLREAGAFLRDGRLPDGTRVSQASLPSNDVNDGILAFESGAFDVAARAFRGHASSAATIPAKGHRFRGAAWNLTHAGAAYAAAGDTASARRLADTVEAIGAQSLFGRGMRLHHFLRGLLLAREGRHSEAVERYRHAVMSWTQGYTRINYEMARSLLALGRPADAVYPLQAALRGGIDGSNLYVTRTEVHELLAQSFAAVGRTDSAAAHYREVARAWEHADPAFTARRRAALGWLSASAR